MPIPSLGSPWFGVNRRDWDHKTVSTATVYRGIRAGAFPEDVREFLRRRGKTPGAP
jgi:hypothetical protein